MARQQRGRGGGYTQKQKFEAERFKAERKEGRRSAGVRHGRQMESQESRQAHETGLARFAAGFQPGDDGGRVRGRKVSHDIPKRYRHMTAKQRADLTRTQSRKRMLAAKARGRVPTTTIQMAGQAKPTTFVGGHPRNRPGGVVTGEERKKYEGFLTAAERSQRIPGMQKTGAPPVSEQISSYREKMGRPAAGPAAQPTGGELEAARGYGAPLSTQEQQDVLGRMAGMQVVGQPQNLQEFGRGQVTPEAAAAGQPVGERLGALSARRNLLRQFIAQEPGNPRNAEYQQELQAIEAETARISAGPFGAALTGPAVDGERGYIPVPGFEPGPQEMSLQTGAVRPGLGLSPAETEAIQVGHALRGRQLPDPYAVTTPYSMDMISPEAAAPMLARRPEADPAAYWQRQIQGIDAQLPEHMRGRQVSVMGREGKPVQQLTYPEPNIPEPAPGAAGGMQRLPESPLEAAQRGQLEMQTKIAGTQAGVLTGKPDPLADPETAETTLKAAAGAIPSVRTSPSVTTGVRGWRQSIATTSQRIQSEIANVNKRKPGSGAQLAQQLAEQGWVKELRGAVQSFRAGGFWRTFWTMLPSNADIRDMGSHVENVQNAVSEAEAMIQMIDDAALGR